MTENVPFNYIDEANVTASNQFHGDKVSFDLFRDVVRDCIANIALLDKIKKAIFYGRELPIHLQLTGNEANGNCNRLQMHNLHDDPNEGVLLLHSIVGITTEAGELLEMLYAACVENKAFDLVQFGEEVGDVQWYEAIGLKAAGLTFDKVQRLNIAKLRHRFPNKFTEHDANNRDLFGERAKLEGKPECRIENWASLGNVLFGDVRNHPIHGDADGCRTSTIVRMDEANGFCETKNTLYRLGNKAV